MARFQSFDSFLLLCAVVYTILLPLAASDAAYPPPYGLDSFLLLCAVVYTILLPLAASDVAYPPPYGLDSTEEDLFPVRREVYGGGRIIDISHRYHPDMPLWESNDGIGQFLWLPKSMKNMSLANDSEMKLSNHAGTHVDAPGHVNDHYFDGGFDVDTLDLEVLNVLQAHSNWQRTEFFKADSSEVAGSIHGALERRAFSWNAGYFLEGPALLVDVPRDKNITGALCIRRNLTQVTWDS